MYEGGVDINTKVVLEIATIVLALALAAVLIVVYVVPDDDEFRTTLNDDVRYSTTFDIKDDYTGSSMNGSVFASHSGSDTKITISTHIEITDADDGPAFIYLDKGLLLDDVLSNFAGSISDSKLGYAYSGEGGMVNRLEIGYIHPRASDKGSGDLVATIVFAKGASIPSEVKLAVAIGARTYENGVHAIGVTYEDMVIPICAD